MLLFLVMTRIDMRRDDTAWYILVALARTQIPIISEQGTEAAREFGTNKRSVKMGTQAAGCRKCSRSR